ncbi:acid protease [Ascoidea rubescens DSM 1968]|uniref:Acid protease n=1 Tax=Ascoidea rubescens DSM 1968 TaxID=1344418 RepID=A0A1D2VH48_9ASCO|nr:acid protease [Ascoidea rubescens DSM 1968]ODV60880.1 acid protease [Ascoidea rubescens DSM 1968]
MYARIFVGNPEQEILLAVHLGACYSVLQSPVNPNCEKTTFENVSYYQDFFNQFTSSLNCDLYGTYDDSNSTNYSPLLLEDADNTCQIGGMLGVLGTDIFAFSNQLLIDNFPFCNVYYNAQTPVGILSLFGLKSNPDCNKEVPNLWDLLIKNNYIKRKIMSFTFANSAGSNGISQILFGAIDKSKYSDKYLTTIPMINPSNQAQEESYTYAITLNGLTLNGQSLFPQPEKNYAVKFNINGWDSDIKSTYIPSEVYLELYLFDGDHNKITNCSEVDYDCINNFLNKENFTFDFSGFNLSIPAYELIGLYSSDKQSSLNNEKYWLDWNDSVKSASYPNQFLVSESEFLLGLNILKYLYLVFDIDHETISLGRSLHNASNTANSSKVQDDISIDVITDNSSLLPMASKAALYNSSYYLYKTEILKKYSDYNYTTVSTDERNQTHTKSKLIFGIYTKVVTTEFYSSEAMESFFSSLNESSFSSSKNYSTYITNRTRLYRSYAVAVRDFDLSIQNQFYLSYIFILLLFF